MISLRKTLCFTASLCLILTAGVTVAQEGVVRMSDRSNASGAEGAGVVRMGASTGSAIRQVSFESGGGPCGEACGAQNCLPGCTAPGQCCIVPNGTNCGVCGDGVCGNGGWGNGACGNGACGPQSSCNTCFSGCNTSGSFCGCNPCQCNPCHCGRGCHHGSFGDGYRDHMNTLFAGPVDSGTGSRVRDCWHGQSMSFRNKNSRLSNLLFGWMVPSGFCGHGAPPVGGYHVTYADQPDYIDPRDTQMYGTQEYGMPIAVPLAPNVNHTYNYSAGLPASRITHIGNYNPQTSPQPLYHQTW
jgi:hypothetical protein